MQLFYSSDIIPPIHTLSEEESKHCVRVLRLGVGDKLHITDGKQAVCYPGCEAQMGSARLRTDLACVTDGKVITAASAGCAIPFGLALIEALKGKETADKIAGQIVIR